MPDTMTATAKTRTGEDVTLEIPIPTSQRADDWNAAMAATAEKANVEIPGAAPAPAPAAAAAPTATADATKTTDDKTIYRATLTVNGQEMVFEGPDAAQVLSQYTAAVEAAQIAGTPAASTKETTTDKKPALSAAEMFEIGTKLISGDASGLDTLIEKSGAVGRYLESQGVSIEQLKAATQKTQSDSQMTALTTARDQFIAKVKTGAIDFPGGAQNEKMMGIMLARVQAEDKAAGKSGAFTLDSFERAYALMKAENLVFPAEKPNTQQTTPQSTVTTKPAPGSTVTGTAGGGPPATTTVQSTRPKLELDMSQMTPHQYMTAYNAAIDQGYKEGVDLFIKT